MKKNTLFVAALVALLLAFVVGRQFYTTAQDEQATAAAPAAMATLVRPHSPALGPADAPVVIVEFLDPACETCAAFYPMVKEMPLPSFGYAQLKALVDDALRAAR